MGKFTWNDLQERINNMSEDFNIEDYRLCTPKGTPFLWDGI